MQYKQLYQLIGILSVIVPQFLFAQITVSKIDGNFNAMSREGVIYALPRTIIQVDVTIEQKEMLAGPLRNYAEEYLGITNIITQNTVEYNIEDINMNTLAEPDPEQYYFISMGEKTSREVWRTLLKMNGGGIITSLNYSSPAGEMKAKAIPDILSAEEVMEIFSTYAGMNKYAKIDTIVRTINIDTITIEDYTFRTTMVEKPLELKAQEMAEMISKLREDRYNLLTGYQEVNYSEGALRYMHDGLLKMENEYLRLFTGLTAKKLLKYSFTFIPSPENADEEISLFQISKTSGIGSGEAVSIQVTPSENTSGFTSASANTSSGICYRLPENAFVKLLFRGDVITSKQTTINQFGKLAVLPKDATDIEFDETTGGIKQVKLEIE